MKLLSAGNTKLAKDKILCFGLPAGVTCPGAGVCRRFCFAQKGMYRFPCVVKSRIRNQLISEGGAFVATMIAELKRVRKTYIRIHDSGDFYSQAYLDKWVDIIKANTAKRFYCYTTSLHLNWDEYDRQSNCTRSQSDSTCHQGLIRSDLSITYVNETGSDCDKSDLNAYRRMVARVPIQLKKR